MATYDSPSAKMMTTAVVVGNMLTWNQTTEVQREVILAATITAQPLGLALNATAANDWVYLGMIHGKIYKCVAGSADAIIVGARVTAMAGGKADLVTTAELTKEAASTAQEFVWGWAWTAAAADGDVFELLFSPYEIDLAAA